MYDAAQYVSPILNERDGEKSKLPGAMKSLVDSPVYGSHDHSKTNGAWSSM